MRRKRSPTHGAAGQPRPNRRIHDEELEAERGKHAEPAACPDCKASYRKGRWTWKTAPAGAHEVVCPACQRIRDEYPAGVLHVGGSFVAAHRAELIGLIRNVEERERSEHPLKRIMQIVDADEGLEVSTTDGKLVEAMGRALHEAYEGRLEQPGTTSEKGNLVRVRWVRD